jgi:OmpA-OmpF porin, OOP family
MSFRPPTTAWDMRWWIIAAVAASVSVNAGLYIVLKRYKLAPSERAAAELTTGTFEMDQVTISEQSLRDLPSTELPDLSQKTNNEPVKELPDISEIAEALRDKAVVMTPSLKDMAVNVTLSKPAPGAAGDLVSDAGEKSAVDTDTASLLSKSTTHQSLMKPDADQAIIDATALDAGAGKLSDSIKAPKKGEGGNNGLDGFTNLDDLLNFKGPITGDFKTMLRTDLLFDFGSAELRSEARLSLMKLGAIILTNDKAQFKLVGHTDTIGDEASNDKLSLARANAVKNWLVNSLRIDASHITCEGAGEREPLAGVDPKGDANAQQLNRRVEIHKTGG